MTMANPGKTLIVRRHDEWRQHRTRWQFLLDSYEGGDRYRYARYGQDVRGLPIMNLVRHKREYPPPDAANSYGSTIAGYAAQVEALAQGASTGLLSAEDDFIHRLIRTPVPTFVQESVGKHLNRIFSREVKRKGPADLEAWWEDVDGAGTSVDHWISEVVGPLLLVLGQLDVLLDRPKADGPVKTQADLAAAGLERCIASVILPENMLWWKKDGRDRYVECLVQEYEEDDEGRLVPRYRHWTATGWTLYDADGEVKGQGTHPYGRPPIVRAFHRRKPRCRNVGQSEYEPIAEHMREYYNRDSELVISDSLQAHPAMQGPEEYCTGDDTLPVGPSYLLPMKRLDTTGQPTYIGFSYLDPPKGAAESLRQNKQDIRDTIDRLACLAKPAGSGGTGAGVAHQSGISKQFDNQDLNDLLARRVQTLERAECRFAELAMAVIAGRPVELDDDDADPKVTVTYPQEFDLHSSDDLARVIAEILGDVGSCGSLPETEFELLSALIRLAKPGLTDERYAQLDAELKAFLADAKDRRDRQAEGDAAGLEVTMQQLLNGGHVAPPTPQPAGAATAPAKGGPPTGAPPQPEG